MPLGFILLTGEALNKQTLSYLHHMEEEFHGMEDEVSVEDIPSWIFFTLIWGTTYRNWVTLTRKQKVEGSVKKGLNYKIYITLTYARINDY